MGLVHMITIEIQHKYPRRLQTDDSHLSVVTIGIIPLPLKMSQARALVLQVELIRLQRVTQATFGFRARIRSRRMV